MIRTLIVLALLALSSAAQAQTVSYTEDFTPGDYVDISQGFYICEMSNPRDTMDQLINIPDDNARHARADSAGCPFLGDPDHPQRLKIIDHSADICLDKHYTNTAILCGREAHELVVQRGDQKLTVIWISSDIDFD